MSFVETNSNNTKVINDLFKINDIDSIRTIINSPHIFNMLNFNVVVDSSRNMFIESCIKNTNIEVAEILIESIYNMNIKKHIIDYITALYFKYNKYETALLMMIKYGSDIANVFQHMLSLNVNNCILINFFTKHYDNLNTARDWMMKQIGNYNNIELLQHVQKYYEINENDINNILIGAINKNNRYCLDTIMYIFENYNFGYNVDFFISIIKELFYMDYDEPIYYILTKLIQVSKGDAIEDIINYLEYEEDDNFSTYMIEYIIKTFNDYILPYEYVKIFSQIKTKKMFDIVLKTLNISYQEQIRIKNMIGPVNIVFHWF
jgi:hypothetical protein